MGRAIAGLILLTITTSTSAAAIECQTRKTGDGYWSWRLVDNRKCWYPGCGRIDKKMLHWTTDLNERAGALPPPAVQAEPPKAADSARPKLPPIEPPPIPPGLSTALQAHADELRRSSVRLVYPAAAETERIPLPTPRPASLPRDEIHYTIWPILFLAAFMCAAALRRWQDRNLCDPYRSAPH